MEKICSLIYSNHYNMRPARTSVWTSWCRTNHTIMKDSIWGPGLRSLIPYPYNYIWLPLVEVWSRNKGDSVEWCCWKSRVNQVRISNVIFLEFPFCLPAGFASVPSPFCSSYHVNMLVWCWREPKQSFGQDLLDFQHRRYTQVKLNCSFVAPKEKRWSPRVMGSVLLRLHVWFVLVMSRRVPRNPSCLGRESREGPALRW